MTGKTPRSPSREVQLDDIVWQGVLQGADEALDVLLKTHLALEAILIELLAPLQINDGYLRWGFPKKTEYLLVNGILKQADVNAFDRINEIRNDAAHIFGHQITISSALALARDLESLGVDFSDSMGHYSEEEAVEYYDGLRGILAEIGWCVLFHAATILQESGGRDIFAARETETG